MTMIEKECTNNEFEIELISYIDTKQNIWFKAKDVAKILGYIHTDQALRKHIDSEDRKSYPVKTKGRVRWSTFINESGFYSVVLSSKLEYCLQSENMGNTNCLTIHTTIVLNGK